MHEADAGREAGDNRETKRQRRNIAKVADDDGTSASLQSRDGRQEIGAALHAGSPPEGPAAPTQSQSSASTASRDAGQREATDAQSESQGAGPCNWKLINATLKGEKLVKYRALLPLGPGEGHYRIGDFHSKEDAIRASDRAVLAFYGPGHPSALTCLPAASYHEGRRMGRDLQDFLVALAAPGRPGRSRHVRNAHTWDRGARIMRHRALLPLGPDLGHHALGDFDDELDAIRAADRALLAFYGRGHASARTFFPLASYQEDRVTGQELQQFLASLAPPPGKGKPASQLRRPARRKPPAPKQPALPAPGNAQQRAPGAGAAPFEQPDALEQDKERRVRADRRLKRLHEQQEAARHLASIGAPGPDGDVKEAPEWRPLRVFDTEAPRPDDWNARQSDRHLTWGAGLDWEVRGSRFRAVPDYAADLRHARRCRDAGVAVELIRPVEERLCARCGSARHDTASCPGRAYGEEALLPAAALAAAGKDRGGADPAWTASLAPDLAAVMRTLRAVSGAALACPDMKVFQPLVGALTPEALLALGLLVDECMQAELKAQLAALPGTEAPASGRIPSQGLSPSEQDAEV